MGTELGLTPGTISKRIQAPRGRAVSAAVRSHHALDPHHRGRRDVPRPRRAHPLRDRGGARQRRRQGEQARRQAQDRGARLPRAALRGAGAVRVRARLSRDRRRRSTCTTARSTCRRTATTSPSAPATLADSSLIAKRLAPDRHVVVASPAYLARAGRPLEPEDLARHDCLMLGECRQWSFSRNGAETAVRVSGPLRSNNGELLCRAARRRARPDPRLRARGGLRASAPASSCRCSADYEVATNARCGRSIRAPSMSLPRMRAARLSRRLVSATPATAGGRRRGRHPCRGGGRGDQRRAARAKVLLGAAEPSVQLRRRVRRAAEHAPDGRRSAGPCASGSRAPGIAPPIPAGRGD